MRIKINDYICEVNNDTHTQKLRTMNKQKIFTAGQRVEILFHSSIEKKSEWKPGIFNSYIQASDMNFRIDCTTDEGLHLEFFTAAHPDCVRFPIRPMMDVVKEFLDFKIKDRAKKLIWLHDELKERGFYFLNENQKSEIIAEAKKEIAESQTKKA